MQYSAWEQTQKVLRKSGCKYDSLFSAAKGPEEDEANYGERECARRKPLGKGIQGILSVLPVLPRTSCLCLARICQCVYTDSREL